MEKIRYSEIFHSVQGEGRFVGVPSVFFRTFGCNFHCHGFGQHRDKSKWLKPEFMPYNTTDLSEIKSVKDLPEWHMMMEFDNMAQLDEAFGRVIPRKGQLEKEHISFNKFVEDNIQHALYRDWPDEL